MGVAFKNNPKYYRTQWRSYGECGIVYLLKKNYPTLHIITNDRLQLNGYEVDIWLPDLKIAIEYNGQHHFKPVYGDDVFRKTQESDKAKSEIAAEKDIKIIYIIPDGTVHKGNKTKLTNMFIECCKSLNFVTPTDLTISIDGILLEQSKK
jgi:hypothetical protein